MAKITDLPPVDLLTGGEHIPIVQDGQTRRTTMTAFRALLLPFLQAWYKGDKGDPGGNVMAVGLFTGMALLSVPGGTDLVRTAGFHAAGTGAAEYVADPAVDAAYVAANPRIAFRTANGRGFRLSPQGPVAAEHFGAQGYGSSAAAAAGVASGDALQAMASFAGPARVAIDCAGRWYKVDRTISWASHTQCTGIRLYVQDSNRDIQPVLIDGRDTPRTDLTFTDLEIHGNRLGQRELGYNAAGVPGSVSGTDSQRHGVAMVGRVDRVTLVRPRIWYCAVEAVWIYHDGRDNDPAALRPAHVDDFFARDILILDPDFQWNGRHGGSAEGFDGLTIRGGRMRNNGKDMPGYPKAPYSDGGNARTTTLFMGPKYGRAWDCESYLLGTRYRNFVMEGVDCSDNWGGSILLYHRYHKVAGDICENLRVSRCILTDPHGANGDPGPIGTYVRDDAFPDDYKGDPTYTGTDIVFRGITWSDNDYRDNSLTVANADDVTITGGQAHITAQAFLAVMARMGSRVNIAVRSNRPDIFGFSPVKITGKTAELAAGWTFSNEELKLLGFTASGGLHYRYTAILQADAAENALFNLTLTEGWSRLSGCTCTVVDNASGRGFAGACGPSGNTPNEITFGFGSAGPNPHALTIEFVAALA